MSDYIVSARKYRPGNFSTLIGQDNIAATLRNSIIRGKLAHAYLFCGPRGVGKTTTARIFAKMINCSNPGEDMEPCGVCESCQSFAEGRSYCIHELDAASNNGVEDIKNLIDQVRIPPQVGKYSVYIIDEVHMLSQAAFNAFLKTLEEPPAHAIFILATTEKHKILPTILSRCQTYDFNRISIPDIVRNLRDIATKEGVNIEDESLHIMAQKADGAMRDALTIFDQTVAFCGTSVKYEDVLKNLNVLGYEHCFALVEDFLSGDYASAMLKFDEILSRGFNALHFVCALSSHLRDLAVAKTAGLSALLELPESLKVRYKTQADKCSMKFLFDALAITTQCESAYKGAINPRLHIEFALMKLCYLINAPEGTTLSQVPLVRTTAQQQTAPAAVQTPVSTAVQTPTPVAQPQSAAAPQSAPEEPTAPRRRRSVGFSMNAIISEGSDKATQNDDKPLRVDMPGREEIEQKWKECSRLYASQPRLAATLESSQLEISDDEGALKVTFLVSNEAQVSWIRSKALSRLEGNLQNLLSWPSLKLEVDLSKGGDKPQRAYTPDEQLAEMNKANPEVKKLLSDLDGVLK